MRTLSDLGLRDYPFRVAPDEEYLRLWADRQDVYEAINMKVAPFTRATPSEVLFFWGYYGTGKSHALKHFGYRIQDKGSGLAVYTDLVGCKPDSFLNVYLEIARGISYEDLVESLGRLKSRPGNSSADLHQLVKSVIRDSSSDLIAAIAGLGGTNAQRDASIAWFQGSTLNRSDKEAIGVRDKLKTDSQALGALSGFHDLLLADGRFLALMLDEYQTLAELTDSRMMRVQQGLVGLYNRCPQGLLLILSFTGVQAGAMFHLVPDSLLQRAPSNARIKMPPMTKGDARTFVRDLLMIYRLRGSGGVNLYHPFTEDGIEAVIAEVATRREQLTPRSLSLLMEQVIQTSLASDVHPPFDRVAVGKLLHPPNG